jgi:hypothetical protein
MELSAAPMPTLARAARSQMTDTERLRAIDSMLNEPPLTTISVSKPDRLHPAPVRPRRRRFLIWDLPWTPP